MSISIGNRVSIGMNRRSSSSPIPANAVVDADNSTTIDADGSIVVTD